MKRALRRAGTIFRATRPGWLLLAAFALPPTLCAQTAPQSQSASTAQAASSSSPLAPQAGPIAIIPLDSGSSDAAAKVTGALEVAAGKAIIAASGTVTSGSQTTEVILPHRGRLRVCASTTVKLAADASVPADETPGLLMALDRGALEISFATNPSAGRNADILLTPDFRILIGAPGAAEVKIRLGRHGDTCVDNSLASGDRSSSLGPVNAPYVLVTSLFGDGDYRVQSGQRVMFEHGSLREVVDNEKEPCGCPPPAQGGNEFPLAQSEGLALTPKPSPVAPSPNSAPTQLVEPLVYKSASQAIQPAAGPSPAAASSPNLPANPPAAKKKTGFFAGIGKFLRHLFGAE
jgi:hypothetical protein